MSPNKPANAGSPNKSPKSAKGKISKGSPKKGGQRGLKKTIQALEKNGILPIAIEARSREDIEMLDVDESGSNSPVVNLPTPQAPGVNPPTTPQAPGDDLPTTPQTPGVVNTPVGANQQDQLKIFTEKYGLDFHEKKDFWPGRIIGQVEIVPSYKNQPVMAYPHMMDTPWGRLLVKVRKYVIMEVCQDHVTVLYIATNSGPGLSGKRKNMSEFVAIRDDPKWLSPRLQNMPRYADKDKMQRDCPPDVDIIWAAREWEYNDEKNNNFKCMPQNAYVNVRRPTSLEFNTQTMHLGRLEYPEPQRLWRRWINPFLGPVNNLQPLKQPVQHALTVPSKMNLEWARMNQEREKQRQKMEEERKKERQKMAEEQAKMEEEQAAENKEADFPPFGRPATPKPQEQETWAQRAGKAADSTSPE